MSTVWARLVCVLIDRQCGQELAKLWPRVVVTSGALHRVDEAICGHAHGLHRTRVTVEAQACSERPGRQASLHVHEPDGCVAEHVDARVISCCVFAPHGSHCAAAVDDALRNIHLGPVDQRNTLDRAVGKK